MIKKKDDYRFDNLLSDIRPDSRNRNIPIHTYTQHTQHSSQTVVSFFFLLINHVKSKNNLWNCETK